FLADRNRVGPGPVAQDRVLQRGRIARGQAGIHALVAGRRRRTGRGLLRRLSRLAVGDLLDPLLGQALLALELRAFGADLLQLLLRQPPLLLGFLLALALGQVDLLLAALLLLLAVDPRALGLGIAAHFVLVDRGRIGDPLLRRGLALDRRILLHRGRQRLRRRGHHLRQHRL